MKTTIQIIIAAFMLVLSAYSQEAVPTDIEQFLKTRPSYKKINLEAYNASTTQYQYDVYFCDAAYKSVRGNISVTAMVRKKEIIGYHIQVTLENRKKSPIGSDDIEKAISMTYDLKRYKKVSRGSVGIDNKTTYNWIYVDEAKMNIGLHDAVNELAKKIKP